MKKLLSLLTISTLTASVPAPLLANTALERTKREDICSKIYTSSKFLDLIEKYSKKAEYKKQPSINIDINTKNKTITINNLSKQTSIEIDDKKIDIILKERSSYKSLWKKIMIFFLENSLKKYYSTHPYSKPEFINAIDDVKKIDKHKFLITLNKDLKLDNYFLRKNDNIIINFKPSKGLKKSENKVLPLEKVINSFILNEIKDNKPETIIKAIINQNHNSGLNESDLQLDEEDITENIAYVTSKNPNFSGSTIVLFFIKQEKEKDDTPVKCSINIENDNDAFIESSLDNSSIEIDNKELSFFYDEDYIKKWYRVTGDGLELKLSYTTVARLILFSQEHGIKEFKEYLKELITNVKQINDAGSGGYISESDWDLMVNFICDGYLQLHEKVIYLSKYINDDRNKDIDKYSIFIRTWVGYQWKDLSQEYQDSAFYISEESKYNNWENYSTVL